MVYRVTDVVVDDQSVCGMPRRRAPLRDAQPRMNVALIGRRHELEAIRMARSD